MNRRIELLDDHYDVTLFNRPGGQYLQVDDGEVQPAALAMGADVKGTILLGDRQADIHMAVRGETAYIRAFDRTFTLQIVDPVEQAAQEAGGGSDTARAPMPGIVVQVEVAAGDTVAKGHPMVTIESMKILTLITAPRSGEVSAVHFGPGEAFDKNAVLVTLKQEGEN